MLYLKKYARWLVAARGNSLFSVGKCETDYTRYSLVCLI